MNLGRKPVGWLTLTCAWVRSQLSRVRPICSRIHRKRARLLVGQNQMQLFLPTRFWVLGPSNIPIIWIFGYQAIRAYKDYVRRLKSGRIGPGHPPPSLDDLLSGRDVQR